MIIILILIKPTKIVKNNKLLNEILYNNNEANQSNSYGRIEISKIGLYEYFYDINDDRNNVVIRWSPLDLCRFIHFGSAAPQRRCSRSHLS